jgi:hypothetical protein
MKKIRITKRSERYISYRVNEVSPNEYKITINYFIDDGNPIRNVDLHRVKYIMCSESELPAKEKEIRDIIIETKWRLRRALHALGANEANVEIFLRQKIR